MTESSLSAGDGSARCMRASASMASLTSFAGMTSVGTGSGCSVSHRHDGRADDEELDELAAESAALPTFREPSRPSCAASPRPSRRRCPSRRAPRPRPAGARSRARARRRGRACTAASSHVRAPCRSPDQRLGAHVVDAVAHHEAHGPIAGAEERPEVLPGEIRLERLALRVAEVPPSRCRTAVPIGDELGDVAAPRVEVDRRGARRRCRRRRAPRPPLPCASSRARARGRAPWSCRSSSQPGLDRRPDRRSCGRDLVDRARPSRGRADRSPPPSRAGTR